MVKCLLNKFLFTCSHSLTAGLCHESEVIKLQHYKTHSNFSMSFLLLYSRLCCVLFCPFSQPPLLPPLVVKSNFSHPNYFYTTIGIIKCDAVLCFVYDWVFCVFAPSISFPWQFGLMPKQLEWKCFKGFSQLFLLELASKPRF